MILFFSKMPTKNFGADCRNSDLVRQSVAAPDLIIGGGGGGGVFFFVFWGGGGGGNVFHAKWYKSVTISVS